MPSPSAIITLGYGNGTFNGSPSDVVRFGYGSADVADVPQAERFTITGPTIERFALTGVTQERFAIEGPHKP